MTPHGAPRAARCGAATVNRARSVSRLVVASALVSSCGSDAPSPIAADQVVLERQIQSLRSALERSEQAPLITQGDVVIVVHESVIQTLIDAALPIEGTISDDRYLLRFERVRVTLLDGLALVRLEGRAALAGNLAESAFAEVVVHADLDVVDIDPKSQVLTSRVRLIAFEAREVRVLGQDAPGSDLVEEFGRERLEALAPLLSSVEVPVRIEHQLELPAVGPMPVGIPARDVPIVATVRAVAAIHHQLFVTLDVSVGDTREAR